MTVDLVNKSSVLQALSRHIGAANGVHAGQLAREVVGVPTDKATERHVRKYIVELRLEGAAICGTPETGYFMAETEEELNATIALLSSRVATTNSQITALKKLSLPDLAGQLHLKT
jgi:hypothetical protein